MPYHHYISAFHLAEFSAKPSRKRRQSRIWVHDIEQGKSWPTSAAKAGGRGDYNGVKDVPGVDTQAIEALISQKIEAPASPIIRQINSSLSLPDGGEWDALLAYVALLQANNPARRGALESAQGQALTFMARMMLAQPETFEDSQAECRRDGIPLLGEIPYEQLQAQLEHGITHEAPTTHHVRGLGQLVDATRLFLSERKWTLLVAAQGASDFICGDCPVVGLPSVATEVVVPLGKRTCLLGQREPGPRGLEANSAFVAEMNRRQVSRAGRFVYSSGSTFEFARGH